MITPIIPEPRIKKGNLFDSKQRTTAPPSNNDTNKEETDKQLYSQLLKNKADTYNNKAKNSYKTYSPKAKSTKNDINSKIIATLESTVIKTIEKQIHGARGFIIKSSVADNNGLGKNNDFDMNFTIDDIEQAKNDLADGGYWSATSTAKRILEFSKAVIGNDLSKSAVLYETVQKGFDELKDKLGGNLPDITKNTYNETIHLFDEWVANN